MDERAEGIILRAVPYQDCHHVVTVFTRERGLISVFVRGTHRSRHFSHALVTPLTRAEFCYRVKQGSELFGFREGRVLDQHLDLRRDFATLVVGCEMANALLATQVQWKAAPGLYALFLAYLGQAGETANHGALLSSFLLKTLKHEGLLAVHERCAVCGVALSGAHFSGHEAFCARHAPEGGVELSAVEREDLLLLAAAPNLRAVEELTVSDELRGKCAKLFSELTG